LIKLFELRFLLLLLFFEWTASARKLPHRTALESFGKITVQQQAIEIDFGAYFFHTGATSGDYSNNNWLYE